MILDRLRNQRSGAIPSFVPNVAVNQVPISQPVAALRYVDPNLQPWFTAGDNCIIESLEINLPFGLSFGQLDANLSGAGFLIAWELESGGFGVFPEVPFGVIAFGDCGKILPNLRLTAPNVAGSRWAFSFFPGAPQLLNVSMLGVPALIGAGPFFVNYIIQVKHTLALGI